MAEDFNALLARLHKNGYLATDEDIAQLAVARTTRGAYLKALVARLQASVKADSLEPEEYDVAFNEVAAAARAAVAHGFRTAGVSDATEINRRSNFARTAERALRAFMSAGDVMSLDPRKVTKRGLTAGLAAAPDDPNRQLRSTTKNTADRLIERAQRLAEKDPVGTDALIEVIIARLRSITGDDSDDADD